MSFGDTSIKKHYTATYTGRKWVSEVYPMMCGLTQTSEDVIEAVLFNSSL